METLVTTKLTPSTLRLLRLIAALTGTRQFEVMERLVRDECARLNLPEHPP